MIDPALHGEAGWPRAIAVIYDVHPKGRETRQRYKRAIPLETLVCHKVVEERVAMKAEAAILPCH